jgi:hypothetical protein
VQGRPVWDDDEGQVVRVFGAAKDITEQREAQQALIQAEKLSVAFADTGVGTTFRVWLPQGDAEATEPA